ncbi:MAG: type I restriction enzyme HsdR N-terminal domain-containing protein, partial [Endomicrobiaceae bacterium]|nr:type I restriction enzyme HsdR N-terminal domain-containing protein [Endomicrobiaceae bacterium]
MIDILHKIFSDPLEMLSIFIAKEINALQFYEKEKKSNKWYLKSFSKGEDEKLVYSDKKSAPEEIIRQLFVNRLITKYKYPKNLIDIEVQVVFGREKKRADIVVYNDDKVTPYLIVEVKAPSEKNDVKQLKSYLNAEGAQIGIAVNGLTLEILYRPYPKDFSSLPDIPEYKQEPEDVFEKTFTYMQLREPKQLKQTIQNLEDLVLANSGYDSFDEIFKIIYSKIYDEIQGIEDDKYILQFRARKNSEITKEAINKLFAEAKNEWKDIFEDSDKIRLKSSYLSSIIANLQEFSLMGSNLQVIDDTFEFLIPDVAKSKKGQYFTRRHVIDMCVKMLNPKQGEYMIDTASGSCGFTVHTIFWLTGHLFE